MVYDESVLKFPKLTKKYPFSPIFDQRITLIIDTRGASVVQESRKITFSLSELSSAFEAYGCRTPKFLPAGKLVSCEVVDEDGVKLAFAMEYGCSTHAIEFVYRGLDVLRPLILFCIENNIMMPREGRKAFLIVDGRAVLFIELDLDVDQSVTTAPLMSEHIQFIKDDVTLQKSITTAPI